MSINQLPNEIFTYEIFSYLDIHSIALVSKLNKFFHALIRDNKNLVKSISDYSNVMELFSYSLYSIDKKGLGDSIMNDAIKEVLHIQSMIQNPKLNEPILELKSMIGKTADILNYEDLDEIEAFQEIVNDVFMVISDNRKQLGYSQFKRYDEYDEDNLFISYSDEEELLNQYEEEQKDNKIITGLVYDPSKQ